MTAGVHPSQTRKLRPQSPFARIFAGDTRSRNSVFSLIRTSPRGASAIRANIFLGSVWRVRGWAIGSPLLELKGALLFASRGEGPSLRALQAMFALYGYDLELTGVNDPQTKAVVAAFQRHFRPERVDGEIDSSTVETLRDLLALLKSL